MKLFSAMAVLVFVISLCGLSGNKSNSNNANNSNSNTNSASASSDGSGMSSDDKHKLFQAAAVTRDEKLLREVSKKIGLTDAGGNPSDTYADFAKEHITWAVKNSTFIREINDPAKAREYVEKHK
ncbi:MAG TPA: hypothetical protein VER08_11165 [Pyrinomonadaceae bacterium]|nr:hypothetical protein [Pyrinomonadaceae bacterium]